MRKSDIKMIFLVLLLLGFVLSNDYFQYFQNRQMLIANNLNTTAGVELTGEFVSLNYLKSRITVNIRIFINLETGRNVRFFFQNGSWIPPLTEGSFFPNESEEYLAVVGNRQSDDSGYILIGDTNFRIIGILGTNYPSVLDSMVLVNQIPKGIEIGRIILDSDDGRTLESISALFEYNKLSQENSAAEFIGNEHMQRQIDITRDWFNAIFLILIVFVDYTVYRKHDGVLQLIGFQQLKVFLLGIKRLIIAFIISHFLIAFVDKFFLLGIYRLDFKQILTTVLFLFMLRLIIFIVEQTYNQRRG